MNFNLKDLRERKNLSQAQLAEALNMKWASMHPEDTRHYSVDMIVRMEKDPDKITMESLIPISLVFGLSLDQLLNLSAPKPCAPKIENNWGKIVSVRVALEKAIQGFAVPGDSELASLEELKVLAHRITRKAKIACIGRPDVGKSRTLNTLLGKEILPTNWTPTTSAFVLLKHISDLPPFMGSDRVCVFKESVEEKWDPDRINDEGYCKEWTLARGDYDLIKEYGSHDTSGDDIPVGAIVAYVDSDLLCNCDFIDLPGFNPNGSAIASEDIKAAPENVDRDTLLSAEASKLADGFIYLSIANNFLYGDDLNMVQSIVKMLPTIEKKGENTIPPLGNLFIVATQAHTVDHGNIQSLNGICENAARRLWNLVEEHPCMEAKCRQSGYEYSVDSLRSRFFTSEMESQALTDRLYSELATFIEEIPSVQAKEVANSLHFFCSSQIDRLVSRKEFLCALLSDHEGMKKRLEELEQNEPSRAADYRKKVYRFTDVINGMKEESREDCSRVFVDVINPAHIVSVIERHGLKRNRKDMEELISLLNAELENKLTVALAKKSQTLSEQLEMFLKECQNVFSDKVSTSDIGSVATAFHVGRAFAGGLSGLATFGALAAWAATCGNLGGYILVAKATSLLAALGIHVGGSAAVISAVSAIGGPVTLGIALAVMAAVGTILALGGTWKKVIGGKIVKQYEKGEVLESLKKAANQFWQETLDAFRAGADQVEEDWQLYMQEYKAKVAEFNEKEYILEIENIDKMKDFYEGFMEICM